MGPDDRRRSDGDGSTALAHVLADESVWAEPPSDLFDRITTEVTAARPAAVESPSPRRRHVLLVAAATVVALVAGFVVGSRGEDSPGDGPPPIAAATLTGTEHAPDAVATVEAFDRGAGFSIVLDVAGLSPAPDDGYYEGWVGSVDGDEVGVGTFHMRGGDDTVVLWSGVDLAVYTTLVVRAVGPDGVGDTVLSGAFVAP